MTETTRLYRVESSVEAELPDWIKEGQDASGHTEAKGRWFVADPSMLDWYREDTGDHAVTVFVDVPTCDLERYRVSSCSEQLGHKPVKSYSRDPENEFFLPRELAAQAQPELSDHDRAMQDALERASYIREDREMER